MSGRAGLASKLLFEGFEGEEIVAEDEAVVEKVAVRHAMVSVIGLIGIFQQDERLQFLPIHASSSFGLWVMVV